MNLNLFHIFVPFHLNMLRVIMQMLKIMLIVHAESIHLCCDFFEVIMLHVYHVEMLYRNCIYVNFAHRLVVIPVQRLNQPYTTCFIVL